MISSRFQISSGRVMLWPIDLGSGEAVSRAIQYAVAHGLELLSDDAEPSHKA